MRARILVVDDEDPFREMLKSWLEGDGHEASEAADGEQAIRMVQSEPFDLVLLDINMPGIDGIGVLKFLKEHYPRTEVVMLTGFSEVKLAVDCMKFGATDFLTKPVDVDSLSPRIHSIIRAHHAEQAKERAKQELDQAKADFTAMLVHDLRDPLGGIKVTLESIINAGPGQVLDEVHYSLVQVALAANEKVLNLINDILDLSKLEAGKLHLSKSTVDFPNIVDFACKNLQIPIKKRNLQLEQAFTQNLPKVFVDPDKITQVITNFVSNSIKFTPEGGKIRISADVEDVLDEHEGSTKKRLLVAIADTGFGIAKEQLPLLFQKYEQTDTGKLSRYKGTGLGLVINRRIIQAHEGKVWVKSELNRGTTFYFTIPVPEATPTAESPHL